MANAGAGADVRRPAASTGADRDPRPAVRRSPIAGRLGERPGPQGDRARSAGDPGPGQLDGVIGESGAATDPASSATAGAGARRPGRAKTGVYGEATQDRRSGRVGGSTLGPGRAWRRDDGPGRRGRGNAGPGCSSVRRRRGRGSRAIATTGDGARSARAARPRRRRSGGRRRRGDDGTRRATADDRRGAAVAASRSRRSPAGAARSRSPHRRPASIDVRGSRGRAPAPLIAFATLRSPPGAVRRRCRRPNWPSSEQAPDHTSQGPTRSGGVVRHGPTASSRKVLLDVTLAAPTAPRASTIPDAGGAAHCPPATPGDHDDHRSPPANQDHLRDPPQRQRGAPRAVRGGRPGGPGRARRAPPELHRRALGRRVGRDVRGALADRSRAS